MLVGYNLTFVDETMLTRDIMIEYPSPIEGGYFYKHNKLYYKVDYSKDVSKAIIYPTTLKEFFQLLSECRCSTSKKIMKKDILRYLTKLKAMPPARYKYLIKDKIYTRFPYDHRVAVMVVEGITYTFVVDITKMTQSNLTILVRNEDINEDLLDKPINHERFFKAPTIDEVVQISYPYL